jgi:hypothetical protein
MFNIKQRGVSNMNKEQMDTDIEAELEKVISGEKHTECEYTQKFIKVLDDGRVQAKITCDNEWLEEPVSVITNDDRIGVTPFHKGHVAKLVAQKDNGDEVILYGYFPENIGGGPVREKDENHYIDGICQTLISGPTHDLFGGY